MQSLLVTRFPHGAGGKFLSTVLQTSNRVDHWSTVVQSQKNINQYVAETTLGYCHRVFPVDHSRHMQCEPMVPYSTELYSTTFPRGNDVTSDEYWQQNDYRLAHCRSQNLIANIIFHKPDLPKFCNGANVLTVLVTKNIEQQWVHQTAWSKHFIETDEYIIYAPSSLDHCPLPAIPKLIEYKPEYLFSKDRRDEIYQKYVVDNSTINYYKSKDYFATENNIKNRFIDLHKLFDTDQFLIEMENIFEEFELGYFNKTLIKNMHELWWNRQKKCV